jgi:acyl dehydratase
VEPLSFDDLPLGGEWTTRRRTVTEAEIALFAGVAGDLSPLTIEVGRDGPRPAPPALVVAMAVGLGSVDMPVPSVAEWEWLSWKFPRQVHAGDTIYARWTLTQKRPPVGGAPSSIVVWRVDVHTIDGALCAEGEIGAKVNRNLTAGRQGRVEQAPAGAEVTAPRRRRGRRSRANGAALPEPPPVAAPPASSAKPERAAGPSRRRRRRRSSGSASRAEEHEPRGAHVPETAAAPAEVAAAPAKAGRRGIGGVLRRLRGT